MRGIYKWAGNVIQTLFAVGVIYVIVICVHQAFKIHETHEGTKKMRQSAVPQTVVKPGDDDLGDLRGLPGKPGNGRDGGADDRQANPGKLP